MNLGKRVAWGGVLAATVLTLPLAGSALAADTDDEFSAHLWNLDMVGAEAAWATSTGEDVVVAVVDSGVDLDHPDLAGQLVDGITTVGCGEDVATCGDGDWVGMDGEAQALDSHGTHVTGTVVAAANNGIGVAGIAPDAKVMPVKSLEDGTGTTADIAVGIRWAVDNGADIINMSLGGLPGTELLTVIGLDTVWQEAVDYAVANDVLVVAAAGNSTYPFCSSPANVPGVVCVTSVGPDGLPAFYTNWGLRLDLAGDVVAAPGGSGLGGCDQDVLSTVPVGTGSGCGGADYDAFAGTSMAAPAVSGVAALLTAQCRDRAGVVAAITDTASSPLLGGLLPLWYGAGIVDAEAAVAAPGAAC